MPPRGCGSVLGTGLGGDAPFAGGSRIAQDKDGALTYVQADHLTGPTRFNTGAESNRGSATMRS